MKGSISMLIVFASVQVFAQASKPATPGVANNHIIIKKDSTVYPADTYHNTTGRLDGLLLTMKDFEIGSDGSVLHNGVVVNTVEVNGIVYKNLSPQRAVQMLPSNMVHSVKVIDINDPLAANGTGKVMDIIIKSTRNDQLADIMVSARVVSSVYDMKMSRMRMDDLANSTPALFTAAPIGSDKDDYGDQIPHFIIRPKPGTYDYKVTLTPMPRMRNSNRMRTRNADPAQPINNTQKPR